MFYSLGPLTNNHAGGGANKNRYKYALRFDTYEVKKSVSSLRGPLCGQLVYNYVETVSR